MMRWVTEVRVFGSYLTDTDDLGDLDLAFADERRPTDIDFIDAIEAFAAKHGKEDLTWEDKTQLTRANGQAAHQRAIALHLDARHQRGGERWVYSRTVW